MSIKVIIADDHKIMRQGLCNMLEKESNIQVVAEAEDGQTVLKLVQELSPNIVIMDIAMPKLNGIEATRQITTKKPYIKVIALSMHSDKRFVRAMLRAGAVGYLQKDSAIDELINAIKAVSANKTYMSPDIADIVIKNHISYLQNNDFSVSTILSSRECEVLQLIAEGKSTKEVAKELSLSAKTIETYRQQIMSKLNIRNVAELTKYAIREGLTFLDN